MKYAKDDRTAIFKSNLEIIKLLVERWRGFLKFNPEASLLIWDGVFSHHATLLKEGNPSGRLIPS